MSSDEINLDAIDYLTEEQVRTDLKTFIQTYQTAIQDLEKAMSYFQGGAQENKELKSQYSRLMEEHKKCQSPTEQINKMMTKYHELVKERDELKLQCQKLALKVPATIGPTTGSSTGQDNLLKQVTELTALNEWLKSDIESERSDHTDKWKELYDTYAVTLEERNRFLKQLDDMKSGTTDTSDVAQDRDFWRKQCQELRDKWEDHLEGTDVTYRLDIRDLRKKLEKAENDVVFLNQQNDQLIQTRKELLEQINDLS